MPNLGTGGPPEQVPSTPSLELSYDEVSGGEVIGRGGNAVVVRVEVDRDGESIPVAVKRPRIHGALDDDVVERFVEEARVWERLDDHDNIVEFLDWGTDPSPWLAIEYMDGGTLRGVVDEGRLPLEQAVWVGLCVCRAVRHAHRHGVTHHDIKPANILFRKADGGWMVPKVSDWGLARMMLYATGSIEGLSPQYASPEQYDSKEYGSPDDYTDIYQVGTLLYELFTGRPPHEGSATEVMQGILFEEPEPPSAVADVPPEIDDVVMPALRKEKEERYDTIVYLRDGLADLFDELYTDADDDSRSSSRVATGTPQPPEGRREEGVSDESPQVDEQATVQSGDLPIDEAGDTPIGEVGDTPIDETGEPQDSTREPTSRDEPQREPTRHDEQTPSSGGSPRGTSGPPPGGSAREPSSGGDLSDEPGSESDAGRENDARRESDDSDEASPLSRRALLGVGAFGVGALGVGAWYLLDDTDDEPGDDGADTSDDDPDANDDVDANGDADSRVDDWLADTDNFDWIRDMTDDEEITVDVGAEGNGGYWAFEPAAIEIAQGTTVHWEWTGQGGAHNVVTGGDSDIEFDSGEATEDSAYGFEYTFEEAGVALYRCEPHDGQGMRGAIVVDSEW